MCMQTTENQATRFLTMHKAAIRELRKIHQNKKEIFLLKSLLNNIYILTLSHKGRIGI